MIELKNISKTFKWKNQKIDALTQVNLSIEDGDIYGIIGFSGAGKSTLLRLINGLERPTSGSVFVNEREIAAFHNNELRKFRKKISMVFQQFNLLESKTVYENVEMPLKLNHEAKAKRRAKVQEIMEFVGLSDKLDAYPSQLSGGQKQRVGIARALITDPEIILCDEVTSALDPHTTDSILDLLHEINKNMHITMVTVTHEMHVVQRVCNKVAVMENGIIIEQGTIEDVFGRPQNEVTRGFVSMAINDQICQTVVETLQRERQLNGQNDKEQKASLPVWVVKYWGRNRTIEIVQALREDAQKEIRILHTADSELQNKVLNTLIFMADATPEELERIGENLANMDLYIERKDLW